MFNFEKAFRYVTLVADCDVGEIAEYLSAMSVGEDGVSFAVTSDVALKGQRHLWLTEAARQRVLRNRDPYLRIGLNPDGILELDRE